MLGRFSDADERLARLFQAEQADAELLHQGIPHWYAVELAWFRNDHARGERHASQLPASLPRRQPVLVRGSRVIARGLAARRQETSAKPTAFSSRHWTHPAAAKRPWSWRPEYWHSRPTISCGRTIHGAPVKLPRRRLAWRDGRQIAWPSATRALSRPGHVSSGSQPAEDARGLLDRASALIDETGAKAFEAMMLRVRARASEEKNLAPPHRS